RRNALADNLLTKRTMGTPALSLVFLGLPIADVVIGTVLAVGAQRPDIRLVVLIVLAGIGVLVGIAPRIEHVVVAKVRSGPPLRNRIVFRLDQQRFQALLGVRIVVVLAPVQFQRLLKRVDLKDDAVFLRLFLRPAERRE